MFVFFFFADGRIDQEAAAQARMTGRNGNSMFSFCRDPELWLGSPQFMRIYRNFEVRTNLTPCFFVYLISCPIFLCCFLFFILPCIYPKHISQEFSTLTIHGLPRLVFPFLFRLFSFFFLEFLQKQFLNNFSVLSSHGFPRLSVVCSFRLLFFFLLFSRKIKCHGTFLLYLTLIYIYIYCMDPSPRFFFLSCLHVFFSSFCFSQKVPQGFHTLVSHIMGSPN